MPVSRNEEPRVLARPSSNSLCALPIKKRLSSMFYSHAPIRPDCLFSNENESKNKDSGLGQRSTLNSCDSTGKCDIPDNSLLEVKEERPLSGKVDSQPTMLPCLSISPEPNPNTTFWTSRNVDNLVKAALTHKLASQENIGTTSVTAVKEEVIAKQGESHSKLELPANSGKVELSLGPKKPHVSSLVDPNAEWSGLMCGTVNPSLLSLSLNKGKDMSHEGSCKNGLNNNDVNSTARIDRSNWDLNSPIDSSEGSGDVPVQDASQIDLLRKTSSSLDINLPISSASVCGSNGDQGKQVVEASEQEFNFLISSIHPTVQHKSVDVLHLSLGSTLPGFDSSALQSLDGNMNSPTCKTVKSEPVVETSIQANAGTVVRPGGTFEGNVGKTEVVKQNMQSIELSTDGPPELLEQKPMKCEPLQEVSLEISTTLDVIAHQSVGRVLQLQESSSSSTLPVPLTPQQGCTSRLSTCSDLSVSGGDLSTPSEYFYHTNEANRCKNALDQANADIAAKNANFDLKELNVFSDKMEASVSVSMNIKDHMVYKKTQDPHNLVVSDEGSPNDGEKISISAGTEEECYGSDYESDGHHAFAGHVDTESLGCVREDEEYEDGEVREPKMQSVAEDLLAEGMDSEKNNESSSKNAHFSSGFSEVGESHCFTTYEKDYSMPVHAESNDDFVRGCDDQAGKINQKDINLRNPLLNEEETTSDDEQRPICATYQGSVDQSAITDVKEGRQNVLCGAPSAGSREAGRNIGEVNNEYIRRSDMSPTALSSLQNAETPVNATSRKDLPNFGSKSRIIKLPRGSDVTFSSNFRPATGRSLSWRSGRERSSDTEEEKFHLRRNRDDSYGYGPKFVQDRFQDCSFGSSRGNFMHGRGRGSGQFDRLHRERSSGRDFESYGGVADHCFRHKRTARDGESEKEHNDYDSRLDGAAFASYRRRKPLDDALCSFRHPHARRLSPSGGEDAAMMGIQMFRSTPRNISPSRCTGEDGSAYVGLPHSEKFNREFPADISDPVYNHQQSMYNGPDGHFIQCNTKITVMQRRSFPRMRSKSPVRSRTWSSPRRRVTEGLKGHQDSSQHRSRVMLYREDRMSSAPRTSFPEEAITPQRHGSPSYSARRLNDMRDMRDVDAVQKHGHLRSLSSRRSPPDGVLSRTHRRVEILDHRERADGDWYFDRSIHTGRFPELHSVESTDERSMYDKRRGGPRQMRNVKEQEGGNFRQNEQLWHEDEFEVSKLKKRRF